MAWLECIGLEMTTGKGVLRRGSFDMSLLQFSAG